jgi:hypothetical protein
MGDSEDSVKKTLYFGARSDVDIITTLEVLEYFLELFFGWRCVIQKLDLYWVDCLDNTA